MLREGPWHYDRQLIIRGELHGEEQPMVVLLTHCPFWIRICNVPLNRRDRESIMKIGSSLGNVVKVNDSDVNLWGQFIRVMVFIHISQPLRRIFMVVNSKGYRVWVYFRYERLQTFYYWCGLIGHIKDDCETKPESVDANMWPYDQSLRASPFKNKYIFYVMSSGSSTKKKAYNEGESGTIKPIRWASIEGSNES